MGVIPAGPNYATYGRTFRNTRGIRIQYRRLPMPLPCESTRIGPRTPPPCPHREPAASVDAPQAAGRSLQAAPVR